MPVGKRQILPFFYFQKKSSKNKKSVNVWILRAFLLHAEETIDYVECPISTLVLTDKIATSKSEIYFQNCVTKHSHSPKTGPKYAGRQASNFAIFFISKKKFEK
jgi:hypothetical protein